MLQQYRIPNSKKVARRCRHATLQAYYDTTRMWEGRAVTSSYLPHGHGTRLFMFRRTWQPSYSSHVGLIQWHTLLDTSWDVLSSAVTSPQPLEKKATAVGHAVHPQFRHIPTRAPVQRCVLTCPPVHASALLARTTARACPDSAASHPAPMAPSSPPSPPAAPTSP